MIVIKDEAVFAGPFVPVRIFYRKDFPGRHDLTFA